MYIVLTRTLPDFVHIWVQNKTRCNEKRRQQKLMKKRKSCTQIKNIWGWFVCFLQFEQSCTWNHKYWWEQIKQIYSRILSWKAFRPDTVVDNAKESSQQSSLRKHATLWLNTSSGLRTFSHFPGQWWLGQIPCGARCKQHENKTDEGQTQLLSGTTHSLVLLVLCQEMKTCIKSPNF